MPILAVIFMLCIRVLMDYKYAPFTDKFQDFFFTAKEFSITLEEQ